MAITDEQKIDLLFKKLAFGAAKTDTSDQKGPTNEAIASPLLSRSDKLWAQSDTIPAVAPGSTTGVLRYYQVYELTPDITSTTNRSWLANKTDWIPTEFGSTYQVKVYLHTPNDSDNAVDISNQVFAAGSGNNDEWYFDYQSGVLNFIGSNLPSGISGKSVYIQAYRYVGNFGLSAVGLDSDSVIALINENAVSLTDSDLKAFADLRNDIDSDSIRIQDLQTQINNLVDDAGFDSDQVVAIINENVVPYNDSTLVARLDSDSVKLQQLQSDVDILDLEIIGLNASLNARLDSDSIKIQDLQTQIENIDVADIRARLDSDSIVIQNIRTAVDSDFDLFNTKIALFNGLTDSDLTTVSNLRNDVDSDSIRIQDLQTQINNLVDDAGFDSDQIVAIISENVVPYDDSVIVARLDSDSVKLQQLQSDVDILDLEIIGLNASLNTRLDSDSIRIQQIQSDLETEINTTDAEITTITARLDSDSTTLQQIRTDLNDSDFIINRTPLRTKDISFSTTTPNQLLDTYDANEHGTVKYIISARQGANWQNSEFVVNHDGTTAYGIEYAVFDSGGGDVYFVDAVLNSGVIEILISPQLTGISVSTVRMQID